jgi:hypothetical protein
MADSPSNRAPDTAASQSTRQMLDDLDALMQRMLALPVQTPDEEGQPPTVVEPAPVATPAPAAAQYPVHPPAVTVQAPMPSAAHDDYVGRSLETRPKAPERAPVLRPAHEDSPEPTVAAPTYLPEGAEALLPVILHPPGAKKEATLQSGSAAAPVVTPPAPSPSPSLAPRPLGLKSAPARRPTPSPLGPGWSMRLLIYLNRSFDRCTPWLGGAGRWLRSDHGRTVVGWTGVAMFAVALVWAALRFLV